MADYDPILEQLFDSSLPTYRHSVFIQYRVPEGSDKNARLGFMKQMERFYNERRIPHELWEAIGAIGAQVNNTEFNLLKCIPEIELMLDGDLECVLEQKLN